MLTSIGIQGFKSIHNIPSLELGQVNVFIGANGSGKSNLLEAVGMLSAAADGRVDADHLLRRGVRHGVSGLYKTSLKGMEQSDDNDIVLKAAGSWNGVEANYEVSLNNPPPGIWIYRQEKLCDKKLERHLPTSSNRIKKGIIDETLGRFLKKVGYFRFYTDKPETVELYRALTDYAIFTPTTPVLRGIQPDIVPSEPLGLFGGRLAEAVEDILDPENESLGGADLDDVLDLLEWVDEFDITAPSRELLSPHVPSLRSLVRFRDYWMNEKRNRVSGYDASEGALYVLFTLILALHPRTPGFFAIDNFCQTMNPRLARGVTRLFCNLMLESDPPRQALLTTHSPLVLDGLDLRDDRIRLFAVDRSQDTHGATKVSRVRLSDELLEKGEKGTPLSMMWSMGLLGGVPDIF
ncbi:AAA family ATPase [Desulfobacterales bacterium HSG2]|nr:AAA family ATPase [Desulfobacterales bacterium HSG2]